MHEVRTELPYAGAFASGSVLGHLVATSTPGVEEWRDGAYRRTVALPGGPGIVSLTVLPGRVRARFWLTAADDEPEAVRRCRRLLDLDADLAVVDGVLGRDPLLGPLVVASPGRRLPGTTDPCELALKVVLGQQVSTAAARTLAARLAVGHGTPVDDPDGGLTRLFPSPQVIARIDPAELAMPRRRAETVVRLAGLLADGSVRLTDVADARAQLSGVAGIGPWTIEIVAMRGLGDPDAYPAGDLGVRKALARLPGAAPETWKPWRSYATQHLWAALDHEINRLPAP